MKGGNGVSVSERNYAVRRRRTKSLNRAYQIDAAENPFRGADEVRKTKKREYPPALAFILLRFKRNYVRCANSVSAFQLFLFLTYSSPAAPRIISAHVDGSGTAFGS